MSVKPLILLTLILSSSFASGVQEQQARDFFQRLQELAAQFNPELIGMYSDDAKVRSLRTYPTGQKREMSLSGKQFKALLASALPLAKQRGDISTYSNVTITTDGKTAKIKADRYSKLKDYTDTGYYLIVAESPSGQLQIIEEYTATRP